MDITGGAAYAQAVFQNTNAYLATLTPDNLKHPLDLAALGLG